MDLFRKAKIVTLCGQNGKFLLANNDKNSVNQDRNGSSETARWTVELVPYFLNKIRFKSYHQLYLTTINGSSPPSGDVLNAVQTPPMIPDSLIEWEPIGEGTQVKLKNVQNGEFLKVNRGVIRKTKRKLMKRCPTDVDELWDIKIIEVLQIEDLHMAASFRYLHATQEVQLKARKFFDSIDEDQNGEVSIGEFIKYLEKSNPPIDCKLFDDLDRNDDGILQFGEIVTMHYMLITQAQPQPDPQNPRGKEHDGAFRVLSRALSVVATVIGLSASCVDLFERI